MITFHTSFNEDEMVLLLDALYGHRKALNYQSDAVDIMIDRLTPEACELGYAEFSEPQVDYYAHEDFKTFEEASEYFHEIAERDNIPTTFWSIYEMGKVMDKRVDGAVERIEYDTQIWNGKTTVIETAKSELTWAELWGYIDLAVRASGDEHHVFIEDVAIDEAGTATIHTGS